MFDFKEFYKLPLLTYDLRYDNWIYDAAGNICLDIYISQLHKKEIKYFNDIVEKINGEKIDLKTKFRFDSRYFQIYDLSYPDDPILNIRGCGRLMGLSGLDSTNTNDVMRQFGKFCVDRLNE